MKCKDLHKCKDCVEYYKYNEGAGVISEMCYSMKFRKEVKNKEHGYMYLYTDLTKNNPNIKGDCEYFGPKIPPFYGA